MLEEGIARRLRPSLVPNARQCLDGSIGNDAPCVLTLFAIHFHVLRRHLRFVGPSSLVSKTVGISHGSSFAYPLTGRPWCLSGVT